MIEARDLFLDEILEQPAALVGALRYWRAGADLRARLAALASDASGPVVLTGMGSSLDACYPASVFLNRRGRAAFPVETSELLHYFPEVVTPGTLLVVVTQSGESAEPVRLLERLAPGGRVVGVTNQPDSAVARRSALVVDLRAGPELTVSTKTYAATLIALGALAHVIAGDEINAYERQVEVTIAALEEFLRGWQSRVEPLVALAAARDHLSLVGRGPSLATAHEAALILKEAGHRVCEAISGGLFRHGPIETVSERSGYILFPGDPRTRDLIMGLGRDIRGHGGGVVFVGGDAGAAGAGDTVAIAEVDPLLLPVLEIVPIQLLAWSLASREGRTIRGFDRLTKVTRTE